VSEKDRLKKEMLSKVKDTKLALLAMTEDQLHTTTKRTIVENEQMTSELQYQSRATEEVLLMNQKLREKNKKLKRQTELHEEAEHLLAERTNFLKKLVAKLRTKVQRLTAEKQDQQQKTRMIEASLVEKEETLHALLTADIQQLALTHEIANDKR
jgi:hypothetical protein